MLLHYVLWCVFNKAANENMPNVFKENLFWKVTEMVLRLYLWPRMETQK